MNTRALEALIGATLIALCFGFTCGIWYGVGAFGAILLADSFIN